MRNVMIMLALALFAGCATKEMKSTPFYEGTDVTYTGNPEDRVNVWPVAYWREPVGSVLWPLTSFSDDHFALRPVYSQYKQGGRDGAFDEFNFLWPICQADLKGDDYRVFPFFWGTDSERHAYQTLFPIYWNGADYNSLFPLWIYSNSGKHSHLSVLFGMAGASSDKGREANWCFPLWYWNSGGTFVTTVYGRWKNGWAVPPLLSWGESKENGDYSARCLLGLGGVKKEKEDVEHWAFPLYNRDELMCYDSNRLCKTHLLLNFVGWESKGDQLRSSYAFPLYSWNADRSFLSPLFYWDNDGSLMTPLGGRLVSGGTTNVFFTPIAKHTTGKKTGGMVFPLWGKETDCDFAEKVGKLDCERLPDDIRIWTESTTNNALSRLGVQDQPIVFTRRRASTVTGHDDTDWLLLFSWYDRVDGDIGYRHEGTNTYELARSIQRGNGLLLKYEYERTAKYSAIDRKKESDGETAETSFLIWLYNHTREKNLMKNDTYSQHRVLWRLWDWEEKNGNVALDVFPGFTYDSKTNGYAKTSFLWRFFRYERDPEKGTAVDLLFIPVWR